MHSKKKESSSLKYRELIEFINGAELLRFILLIELNAIFETSFSKYPLPGLSSFLNNGTLFPCRNEASHSAILLKGKQVL